ncbi:MAG: biotin/lipoyl-containing protein [Stenotrophomonas maltophilia]
MALTTFRVKVGDRWYTVEVGDLTRSPVEVIVEGESFFVDLENLPLPPQPPPRPRRGRTGTPAVAALPPSATEAAPHQPSSDNILRSPMPGRVMSITVRPGQRVSAGEEVCVVEAMKMEQSIRAPRAGVIKAIHVQPLDSVSADDPLIELE